MDPLQSRSIALAGARRLLALIDADGRFLYRYNAATGAVLEGYNTARHAAAVWILAHAARGLGERDLIGPAECAMRWLIERHIRPFGEERLPGVVEDDAIELGGVALALLAALELYRAGHAPQLLDLARGLGRYLLSQKESGGEFIHRLAVATGRPFGAISPYAPGQVLLALAELYASSEDKSFLDPALESESILASRDYGVSEQSHWMLYAIQALEAVAPRAAHRAHACRIAGAMIVYPLYRNYGKSTSIACHAEALVAYLKLLRRHPAETGVEDLPSEALARPALEEDLRALVDFRTADGAFLEGGDAPEVQIDNIQHATAAFLGHALLYSETTGELSATR
jgi:hypothetical protein